MKAIAVEGLSIGTCISKDVYNDLGNIILSQGTEITERHLDYFKAHNISYVYIQETFDTLDDERNFKLLTSDKYRNLNQCYGNVVDAFKNIYYKVQNERFEQEDLEHLEEELKPLLSTVLLDNDVLGSLRLVAYEEDYHITHAVNVAMLSAMTGKWLRLDYKSIEQIALAGVLHDLGKAFVPREILFKIGSLNSAEMSIMKTHAQRGYEFLKASELFPKEVLAAVLFHHERGDGSGYPSALKFDQTPYFARIIAVADVFDAVTSNRVYKAGISSFGAFSVIKDESFRGLDPTISEVFLSNIASHFINNRVMLSDGRVGEVVYVNKYALNRPLIRINDNDYVDLSLDYSLQIEDVMPL